MTGLLGQIFQAIVTGAGAASGSALVARSIQIRTAKVDLAGSVAGLMQSASGYNEHVYHAAPTKTLHERGVRHVHSQDREPNDKHSGARQTRGAAKSVVGLLEAFGVSVSESTVKLIGFASTLAGIAKTYQELMKRWNQFADETYNANQALRRYSAEINVAYAKLEMTSMRFRFHMAAATEASNAEVTEQFDRFLQSLLPLAELTQNLKNVFAAANLRMRADLLEFVNEIGLVDLIKKLLGVDWDDKPDRMQSPWGQAITERAAQYYQGPRMPALGGA